MQHAASGCPFLPCWPGTFRYRRRLGCPRRITTHVAARAPGMRTQHNVDALHPVAFDVAARSGSTRPRWPPSREARRAGVSTTAAEGECLRGVDVELRPQSGRYRSALSSHPLYTRPPLLHQRWTTTPLDATRRCHGRCPRCPRLTSPYSVSPLVLPRSPHLRVSCSLCRPPPGHHSRYQAVSTPQSIASRAALHTSGERRREQGPSCSTRSGCVLANCRSACPPASPRCTALPQTRSSPPSPGSTSPDDLHHALRALFRCAKRPSPAALFHTLPYLPLVRPAPQRTTCVIIRHRLPFLHRSRLYSVGDELQDSHLSLARWTRAHQPLKQTGSTPPPQLFASSCVALLLLTNCTRSITLLLPRFL
jgi:hypothetical protein